MTYQEAIDHLGNPVVRRRKSIGHTILQALGAIACVVGLGMLVWVR